MELISACGVHTLSDLRLSRFTFARGTDIMGLIRQRVFPRVGLAPLRKFSRPCQIKPNLKDIQTIDRYYSDWTR